MNFRGQNRTNDTHASTTVPDASSYRKVRGQEARLGFLGHVLTDNRHGLVVATRLTRAMGTAAPEASLKMVREKRKSRQGRFTSGGDKIYDTREHVAALCELNVTPHVEQNTSRPGGSTIDHRTTQHPG